MAAALKFPFKKIVTHEPYRLEFEILGLPMTPDERTKCNWRRKKHHDTVLRGLTMSSARRYGPGPSVRSVIVTLTRFSNTPLEQHELKSSFEPVTNGILMAKGVYRSPNSVTVKYDWEQSEIGKIRVVIEEANLASGLEF